MRSVRIKTPPYIKPATMPGSHSAPCPKPKTSALMSNAVAPTVLEAYRFEIGGGDPAQQITAIGQLLRDRHRDHGRGRSHRDPQRDDPGIAASAAGGMALGVVRKPAATIQKDEHHKAGERPQRQLHRQVRHPQFRPGPTSSAAGAASSRKTYSFSEAVRYRTRHHPRDQDRQKRQQIGRGWVLTVLPRYARRGFGPDCCD